MASSNAPNPRNASRRSAFSRSNPRNTSGNALSRAATNAANAFCRSARFAFPSTNTFRKASSAALLPNVSDSVCANCRTSAFELLASLGAISFQPFGILILRCPFNAALMPLRISRWNAGSSTSFSTPTNAANASASCARSGVGSDNAKASNKNRTRFMRRDYSFLPASRPVAIRCVMNWRTLGI